MSAPVLNRILTLETAVRVPDQAGGYDTVWTQVGRHWAQILPGSGGERLENALPKSRVPLRIIVRAAPVGSTGRPTAGQRFREGARIYAVTAVTERDAALRYLVCMAEEEVVA